MKNQFAVAFILFAALLAVGCTQPSSRPTPEPTAQIAQPTQTPEPTANAAETATPMATIAESPTAAISEPAMTPAPNYASEAAVQITSKGFEPNEIRVKSGITVTFTNKDSKPHRVASNPHPSHDGYPTTGGCIGSTFDSCKNIAPGESWAFRFRFNGRWAYHDHLNPSTTGIIQVG